MISKDSPIFIAGHNGMVGSSILRYFLNKGFKNILIKNKKELDLRNQKEVDVFFKNNKIECVILAAAKVGGIQANINYPADFFYDNLLIQTNVIYGAKNYNVKKIIFLGSSCIYPTACPQPMKEEYLLSGPLEPTNEGYALAKIFGIKLCEYYSEYYNLNYFSLMPCNVFGPGDNYDLNTSHFLPAILKKIRLIEQNKMKHLYLWGDGKALREVIYVDDLADACLYFLNKHT